VVIILCQSTIAALVKAKLPLDDPEGVFHLGTDAGFGLFKLLLGAIE
jgi:hypothetical protein|tara:strand:+ start:2927 stop:3067 length:141 start_codon:yes stop_codon:yes gene_type:complete